MPCVRLKKSHDCLLLIRCLGQILCSPLPSSTQGDKKGDRILKALGQCLEIADLGLMVLPVCDEHLHIVGDASLVICLYQPQRSPCRLERLRLRLQSLGIVFECPQGISNLGKSAEDGLPIVG